MKKVLEDVLGYLKTFNDYYYSPKGHRDILDYMRAAVIFLLTILVAGAIAILLEGFLCA